MDEIVEAVAEAVRSHEVVGVFYAGKADTCYRAMKGCIALGGDYHDLATAQRACDLLNARAAIEATLQAVRARLTAAIEAIEPPYKQHAQAPECGAYSNGLDAADAAVVATIDHLLLQLRTT